MALLSLALGGTGAGPCLKRQGPRGQAGSQDSDVVSSEISFGILLVLVYRVNYSILTNVSCILERAGLLLSLMETQWFYKAPGGADVPDMPNETICACAFSKFLFDDGRITI